jgi:hypothetical protein
MFSSEYALELSYARCNDDCNLSDFMQQSRPWEAADQLVRIFRKGSLPCSRDPATGLHLKPDD